MAYFDPTQKERASQYFKEGTGLTRKFHYYENKQVIAKHKIVNGKFVPLATDDIWINVAEPRILDVYDLKWDSAKATAQMEEKHVPDFVNRFSENRLSTIKT